MRISVSNLDFYRSYLENEEMPLGVFLHDIKNKEPTKDMLRGRAFAKAMQELEAGADVSEISKDGFRFVFTLDAEIPFYPRKEESRSKDYGGIEVFARCDRILGRTIVDDKSTTYFESEKYMNRYQWRYYLDIWKADQFIWNFWECKEIESNVYEIFALHEIEQFRYPSLEQDCRELALNFKDFAEKNLAVQHA
jgi:hypothetical protein